MQSLIVTANCHHKILAKNGTLIDLDDSVTVDQVAIWESFDVLHDDLARLIRAGKIWNPSTLETQQLSDHF